MSSSRGGTSVTSHRSVVTHTVTYAGRNGQTSSESLGGAFGSSASSPCGSSAMACQIGTATLCIDVMSDSNNCGGCDRVCAHGALCDDGACRPNACNPTFALGTVPMSPIADDLEASESYGYYDFPTHYASGDFNGDGKLDIATTNPYGDTVSVALGRGNGTFEPRTNYPTGGSPKSVAVADLDGDGQLDLVTSNSSDGTVSVLLGLGDGKFEYRVDYPTGKTPRSIAIGDLSGDGIADLATANEEAHSVSVLLGKGLGTFSDPVDHAVGSYPHAIVMGDFNGDRRMDLATADESSKTVSVLLGTGDGAFLEPPNSVRANLHHPHALAVGDLDGDGDLDIAVADRSEVDFPGRATVLLGNGDGTFPVVVDREIARDTRTVATGDLNGDGRLDLISAGQNVIGVALAEEGGTLAPEVRYTTQAADDCLSLGDFDGDSYLDILTVAFGNSATLFGKGDGTFRDLPSQPTGVSPFSLVVGDLNGDGRLDAVTANESSDTVSVLLGAGDGTFSSSVEYPTGPEPIQISISDLNGDGAPDLVTGSAKDGSVTTLLNTGAGAFPSGVDYQSGRAPSQSFAVKALAIGDLDGNGKLTIAMATDANSINLLQQQEDGIFASGMEYPELASGSLLLVDVNRDGLLDLVSASSEQAAIHVRLGGVNSSFGPMYAYAISRPPQYLQAGDLNGDGNLDLVASTIVYHESGASGMVMLMLGDGNGSFVASQNFTTGKTSAGGLRLGDLNGDGSLDAVIDHDDNKVAVLLGAGDGTFACLQYYPIPARIFVLADLNADRRLDLVSTAAYENSLAVMLNTPL